LNEQSPLFLTLSWWFLFSYRSPPVDLKGSFRFRWLHRLGLATEDTRVQFLSFLTALLVSIAALTFFSDPRFSLLAVALPTPRSLTLAPLSAALLVSLERLTPSTDRWMAKREELASTYLLSPLLQPSKRISHFPSSF
jgi:hypothetical protein